MQYLPSAIFYLQVCIHVYLYQLTEATFQKKRGERKDETKLNGGEVKEEVHRKGRKEQKSFLTLSRVYLHRDNNS